MVRVNKYENPHHSFGIRHSQFLAPLIPDVPLDWACSPTSQSQSIIHIHLANQRPCYNFLNFWNVDNGQTQVLLPLPLLNKLFCRHLEMNISIGFLKYLSSFIVHHFISPSHLYTSNKSLVLFSLILVTYYCVCLDWN